MTLKLEEGDVVQLKSGGPAMTVFSVIEAADAKPACRIVTEATAAEPMSEQFTPETPAVKAQVSVVWFTEAHEVRNGNFAVNLLEKPKGP